MYWRFTYEIGSHFLIEAKATLEVGARLHVRTGVHQDGGPALVVSHTLYLFVVNSRIASDIKWKIMSRKNQSR